MILESIIIFLSTIFPLIISKSINPSELDLKVMTHGDTTFVEYFDQEGQKIGVDAFEFFKEEHRKIFVDGLKLNANSVETKDVDFDEMLNLLRDGDKNTNSEYEQLKPSEEFDYGATYLPCYCALRRLPSEAVKHMIPRRNVIAKYLNKIPTTYWCGKGTRARNYNQLGSSAGTDRCCRAHDFCPTKITSEKEITKSHCKCDEELYKCLEQERDTGKNTFSAGLTGFAFFSALKLDCFEKEDGKDDQLIVRKSKKWVLLTGDPDFKQQLLEINPQLAYFPSLNETEIITV